MANRKVSINKLLHEQPYKRYIEALINAYDEICRHFFEHFRFLAYWGELIIDSCKKETDPANALRFAFSYYNHIDNENIDPHEELVANCYLDKIISLYNADKLSGINIARFIRSFKTAGENAARERTEIKTADIEWLPKKNAKSKKAPKIEKVNLSKEEIKIAREFDFAWSCARLWQYLKSHDKESFILHFLCIKKNVPTSKTIADGEVNKLFEKLKNLDIEEPSELKKFLKHFSPSIMTKQEMQTLLKKACLACIKKKKKNGEINDISPSDARIKQLEPIWLLGRFYRIHNYALDFIKQEKLARAVKQFAGIIDSPFLKYNVRNLDKMIKRPSLRVGKHNYPLEEVLLTIFGSKALIEELKNKSNEIIPGKRRNPYKPLLENIEKRSTKHSLVAQLDLANDKIRKFAQTNAFKALIFLSAFPDFFLKYNSDIETNNDIIDGIEKNTVVGGFLYNTIMMQGLENEKNLFFLTDEEFDVWDLLIAGLLLIVFHQQNNKQVKSKESPKEIPVQT